jgi:hypothetical protein
MRLVATGNPDLRGRTRTSHFFVVSFSKWRHWVTACDALLCGSNVGGIGVATRDWTPGVVMRAF